MILSFPRCPQDHNIFPAIFHTVTEGFGKVVILLFFHMDKTFTVPFAEIFRQTVQISHDGIRSHTVFYQCKGSSVTADDPFCFLQKREGDGIGGEISVGKDDCYFFTHILPASISFFSCFTRSFFHWTKNMIPLASAINHIRRMATEEPSFR